MLSAVQGFANRHRKGLVITAGLTGGIYMMGKYAKSKLVEFHEKSASERTAKENMKRRFEQNQQDCVFTVLSLLPTLGDQLLHELNVELITAKLQQTRSQRPTPAPTPDSSMILPPKPAQQDDDKQEREDSAENKEEQEKDKSGKTKDDQEAATISSDGTDSHSKEDSSDSTAASDTNGDSNQSTQPSSTASEADKDETTAAAQDEEVVKSESQESAIETTPDVAEPQAIVKDEVTAAMERKTKLELWNELKVMSFTRTVTALYSLTFLTLLTQV
ncbi:peroxin, partial [Linnemannia gamsii]